MSVSDWIACFWFPSVMLWWVQVTVTPEANRIAVLSSGTSRGLSGVIPVGGHWLPSSGVGAKLEWKKAQKKPRKKNTSDVMKRIIPYRKPFWTVSVWWPWNVLSRMISRHH